DILLPNERDEVAELCLACGAVVADFRALLVYTCDTYYADTRAYLDLRRRVVGRVGAMPAKDKAGLVESWAYEQLWEELPAYQEADPAEQPELAQGVFQLFGDTFASLGQEALELLKASRVRERTAGAAPRPLWRPFVLKLAQAFPAAREWLL